VSLMIRRCGEQVHPRMLYAAAKWVRRVRCWSL